MVARRKKKYESGEAANYVSRKHALRKLQLNLKDFRRLCILKGIHPREPKNRKRAQKGDLTKVVTLYHEKDIRFLLHEPIVHKFRDFKVFLKKVKKALDKGNPDRADRLKLNKPKYSLDHIVRERYPTFVDAVRDLEDCLCLCSLYSTFPRTPKTPVEMVSLCKRLAVEFMHYVIEAKALRKVFVSIKGYYYQAEVMGQTVTWVVPHPSFTYEPPRGVDLRLMSIFVEFYTTMLGFVNFRLFHKLNLKYPPALSNVASTREDDDERVASLNRSLARTVAETDDDNVELDDILDGGDDGGGGTGRKEEMEARKALGKLFEGAKVFLSREVPREPLVFVLRALGGQVSWDSSCSAEEEGATFGEEDSGVTHQVCDRPRDSVGSMRIGRDYVQPQWVFDSVNRGKLLPAHKYFLGEVLPPHLSPFIKEDRRIGDYVPPEEKAMLEEEEQEDGEGKAEEEEEGEEETDEDEGSEEEEKEEGESAEMKVRLGKPEDPKEKEDEKKQLEDEQYRLRVKMIKKKHRGLYKSMMKARRKRVHESKQMERKRRIHDESLKKSSSQEVDV